MFRLVASLLVLLCVGVAFLFSGGSKSSENAVNAETHQERSTSVPPPPASTPAGNKQFNF